MTDPIVQFIEAQLAKDDANIAEMSHYNPDDGGYYSCPATRDEPYGDFGFGEENCDCDLAERRGRAQREVAAKRRRLQQHRPGPNNGVICLWCSVPQAGAYQNWPCLDVRLDASVFEDQPGWNPAWKVRG